MAGLVILTLLSGCTMTFASAAETSTPVEITSFSQFYNLSPEQAVQNLRIRIRGTVLCYDAGWGQLYVFDGNQTAYVKPPKGQAELHQGQYIELTGGTQYDQDTLGWTNLSLTILGKHPVPPPYQLSPANLANDFGQWVETAGQVRVAETSSGRLCLVIHDGAADCEVLVMGEPSTNDFRYLPGSRIRVRGINTSTVLQGRLASARLMVSGMRDLAVIEAATSSFLDSPVVAIEALLDRELGAWTNRPVHINGLIAAYQPGEFIVVKDPTGLIRARISQCTKAALDERINLWGFLSFLPNEAILADAFFEPVHPPKLNLQLSSSFVPPAGTNASPPLMSIAQVLRLSPAQAARHLPVHLQGVITYADPQWNSGFLQGETNAIFFYLTQPEVRRGQWVELTGLTDPGGYAPLITNASVRVLRATNVPTPTRVDLDDLANGRFDSHWVEIEGVVRQLTVDADRLQLSLMSSKGAFRAVVSGVHTPPAAPLIDALVRLRGVCCSEINERQQLTGFNFQVPDLDSMSVLEPPLFDPFSIATTSTRAVARFDPAGLAGRRIKLSGTVTLISPPHGFFLQDDLGGIRVACQQTNEVHLGEVVDVLGFPAIGDFAPHLEQAIFRQIGTGLLPEPKRTTAEEVLAKSVHDSLRVQLEAQLLQAVPDSARPKLVLQSGSIIFTAKLAGEKASPQLLALRPGSLLRLTGVCSLQASQGHQADAFRLLIARAADIQFLKAPPPWTGQQARTLAAIMALVMAAGLGWVWSLRRQVRRQTGAIQDEKNLLATLIDHLPDTVYVKDLEGRYLLTNLAHSRFHGAPSRLHFRGKAGFELFPPDQAKAFAQSDAQVLTGSVPLLCQEEEVPNAEGIRRLLASTKVPLRDQAGNIIGLVGFSRDITETKRAESELRGSEARFRAIWEHSIDGMRLTDAQGQILAVNDAFCQLFKLPRERLVGKPFPVTHRGSGPTGGLEAYRENFTAGRIVPRSTSRVQLWNGEEKDLEVSSCFVEVAAQGRVVLSIVRDVSERRRVESILAYERDLLGTLFENLPDALYFKDLKSRFVRVSRSKLESSWAMALQRHQFHQAQAAAVPGSSCQAPASAPTPSPPPHLATRDAFAEYIIGKTDFDFFEEPRARSAFEDEQEILRTGHPLISKVERTNHPDGRVTWSLTTKMPWRDKDGRLIGTFGVSKDITGIKEAEAKLEIAHRQLVEASRQAGMAEVATGVLHNVGNVLNSVNVSANLLAEKLRHSRASGVAKVVELMRPHAAHLGDFIMNDPRGRRVPDYLAQLAERLAEEQAMLLNEVHCLAGNLEHIKNVVAMQQTYAKRAGVVESVQAVELFEDALRINGGALERHRVQIRRQYPPQLPALTIDKHKVLQILVNLVSNAGHACAQSPGPDKQLTVQLAVVQQQVKFSVSDNGVGIAPENLTRIFSIGFTTRADGHGFGLHSGALAARELGGALRSHSDGPGQGATFVLELPMAPPA